MPTSATCRNGPEDARAGSPERTCRSRMNRAGAAARHCGASACRRGAGAPAMPAAARGFTLLELIVVLLLLALVTALAMPNLERLVAGAARGTERDRILDQFVGLGRQAMLQRRGYVVFGTGDEPDADPPEPGREPADAARGRPGGAAGRPLADPPSHADHERYAIDLPEGWEIGLDRPLVVRANGACLGARLTLRHLGTVDVEVDLEPPYCRVDVDT